MSLIVRRCSNEETKINLLIDQRTEDLHAELQSSAKTHSCILQGCILQGSRVRQTYFDALVVSEVQFAYEGQRQNNRTDKTNEINLNTGYHHPK